MLPTQSPQRHIIQKTTFALVIGTLLWVSLLIFGASQASGVLGLYQVAFGPFVLNEITQVSSEAGRITSFSFESGLLWFFACWAGLGLMMGYLTRNHAKHMR